MFSVNKFINPLVKHGIRNFCTKPNSDNELAKAIREQTKFQKDVFTGACVGIIGTSAICLGFMTYDSLKIKDNY